MNIPSRHQLYLSDGHLWENHWGCNHCVWKDLLHSNLRLTPPSVNTYCIQPTDVHYNILEFHHHLPWPGTASLGNNEDGSSFFFWIQISQYIPASISRKLVNQLYSLDGFLLEITGNAATYVWKILSCWICFNLNFVIFINLLFYGQQSPSTIFNLGVAATLNLVTHPLPHLEPSCLTTEHRKKKDDGNHIVTHKDSARQDHSEKKYIYT